MKKKTASALEYLKEIMQERNWHQNKIEPRKASGYKDLINKGKVSTEKASEILNILGYEKVKEETWAPVPQPKAEA